MPPPPTRAAVDSAQLRSDLVSAVPDLEPAIARLRREVDVFMRSLHAVPDAPRGLRVVATQAANDLLDILDDAVSGRGRPALTSARSLFEELVTALDIVDSEDFEQRYEAHRLVAADLEGRLAVDLAYLDDVARAAEVDRREVLRASAADALAEAIGTYGKGFRLSWAPTNLRARAERHGLADDYDFYALASAVLHGSAGGILGLHAQQFAYDIFRVGPALSLCPLALLEALRFFGRIANAYSKHFGDRVPSGGLGAALESVVELWPRYREAALEVDRRMWPPLTERVVVLALSSESKRWWIHDLQAQLVCEAEAPRVLTPDQHEAIHRTVDAHQRELDEGQTVLLGLVGAEAKPRAGRQWRPIENVFGWRLPQPVSTEQI